MKSLTSVAFSLLMVHFALSYSDEEITFIEEGCDGMGPKINLDVYYDATDETSRQFFLEELIPTWTQVRRCVTFTLKPIKKANPNEIYPSIDDKYHACVLHSDVSDFAKFQFVKCYMETLDSFSLTECSRDYGIPLDTVNNCTKSNLGDTYLTAYLNQAAKTKPPVTMTPKVFLNNLPVVNLRVSILQAVCKISSKPLVCDSITGFQVVYR